MFKTLIILISSLSLIACSESQINDNIECLYTSTDEKTGELINLKQNIVINRNLENVHVSNNGEYHYVSQAEINDKKVVFSHVIEEGMLSMTWEETNIDMDKMTALNRWVYEIKGEQVVETVSGKCKPK